MMPGGSLPIPLPIMILCSYKINGYFVKGSNEGLGHASDFDVDTLVPMAYLINSNALCASCSLSQRRLGNAALITAIKHRARRPGVPDSHALVPRRSTYVSGKNSHRGEH